MSKINKQPIGYSIIAGKFSIIYSLHTLLEWNGDFTKHV